MLNALAHTPVRAGTLLGGTLVVVQVEFIPTFNTSPVVQILSERSLFLFLAFLLIRVQSFVPLFPFFWGLRR